MGERLARLGVLICVVSIFLAGFAVKPAFAEDSGTYTVQSGDSLLQLASHFGISVNELAQANDLEWNAWIYVGQQLAVPGNGSSAQVDASEPAIRDLGPDPLVPDPLPDLPVLSGTPIGPALAFPYARVVQDNAPVYASLREAAQGLDPRRTLGVGYVWVSVEDKLQFDGQEFYRINAGEYVRADVLSFYSPSEFHGVALAAHPERPFAWILKAVQPSITAAGELNPGAPVYQRYDLVQIFATEHLGDQVWYLIGPHQWINQIYVGKVAPKASPEGVDPDARWIEVDLFEQTLAAYEGQRMVYATLVSTGLRGWDTPPGLFEAWLRVQSRKMSGGYGRPDYYFLEDVPWTMYFNRDIALHTAYWHDGFGYRHSHGCVNLPPLDAKWLYEWAPDDVSVWVHDQN